MANCDICKNKLIEDDVYVVSYFGLFWSDIEAKICPKCEPKINEKIKHILQETKSEIING